MQALSSTGHIDPQARVMLMAANTGTVTAQSGLGAYPQPAHSVSLQTFYSGLSWFFAITAFARLDGGNHGGVTFSSGFCSWHVHHCRTYRVFDRTADAQLHLRSAAVSILRHHHR